VATTGPRNWGRELELACLLWGLTPQCPKSLVGDLGLHDDLVAEETLNLGYGLRGRLDHDAAGIACPFDVNARHLADSLLSCHGLQPCLTPDRDDIGGQDQPSPVGSHYTTACPANGIPRPQWEGGSPTSRKIACKIPLAAWDRPMSLGIAWYPGSRESTAASAPQVTGVAIEVPSITA
jgi:hypothetical protein